MSTRQQLEQRSQTKDEPKVFESLVVSFTRGRSEDSSVRTESTSSGLDVGHKVLGRLEIDEEFGSVTSAESFLGRSSVDSNDSKRHGGGVLDGEMSQSSCERNRIVNELENKGEMCSWTYLRLRR